MRVPRFSCSVASYFYVCCLRCKALLPLTASLRRFGVRYGDVDKVQITVTLAEIFDTKKQSPSSTKTATSTLRYSAEPGI